MDLDNYVLLEIKLKINQKQLDWIKSVIFRYNNVTGKVLTAEAILMRVLEHGWSKAEEEMSELESKVKKLKKPKKFKHLTVID